MHLERVRTYVTAPPTGIGGSFWVFVEVDTDDGITGVGECYGVPVSGDIAATMVEDTFNRFCRGVDPHHLETLFRRVYSAGFTQRPDITMMGVFSGIEIAIWDILGKAHNVPVCELLGGRFHDRLRTYSYLYPPNLSATTDGEEDGPDVYHDGDAAAESALRFVEMGFTAIKQDPVGPYSFQGGRELSLFELSRAQDSIGQIRKAVGNRADILLGTHGQMTTASAIRLARRVEQYDPLWFEEPCPPDQIEALKVVSEATSIPLAAGERMTTRKEFYELLRAGVRILQPNVGRSGGLWETKKIAALAELFNAQIAPHIYCGPVAHAAATHLGFTLPNFLILETILSDFHEEVAHSSLVWDQGWMMPPSKPGLGIELNHETLGENPYESGGRLHLEMTQEPLDSNNKKVARELQ